MTTVAGIRAWFWDEVHRLRAGTPALGGERSAMLEGFAGAWAACIVGLLALMLVVVRDPTLESCDLLGHAAIIAGYREGLSAGVLIPWDPGVLAGNDRAHLYAPVVYAMTTFLAWAGHGWIPHADVVACLVMGWAAVVVLAWVIGAWSRHLGMSSLVGAFAVLVWSGIPDTFAGFGFRSSMAVGLYVQAWGHAAAAGAILLLLQGRSWWVIGLALGACAWVHPLAWRLVAILMAARALADLPTAGWRGLIPAAAAGAAGTAIGAPVLGTLALWGFHPLSPATDWLTDMATRLATSPRGWADAPVVAVLIALVIAGFTLGRRRIPGWMWWSTAILLLAALTPAHAVILGAEWYRSLPFLAVVFAVAGAGAFAPRVRPGFAICFAFVLAIAVLTQVGAGRTLTVTPQAQSLAGQFDATGTGRWDPQYAAARGSGVPTWFALHWRLGGPAPMATIDAVEGLARGQVPWGPHGWLPVDTFAAMDALRDHHQVDAIRLARGQGGDALPGVKPLDGHYLLLRLGVTLAAEAVPMIPARFSESEAVTVQRLRMRHRFPDLRWDAQADPVVLPDTADVGSALTWAPPRSTSTGPHAAPATLRVDREGIHLSGATPGAWYRIPVGASPFLRPDGTDVVSRTDSGRIAIKPSQSQATLRYLPFRPVLPFLAVSALGVVALLGLAVCRMGGPGRRAEAFDRA